MNEILVNAASGSQDYYDLLVAGRPSVDLIFADLVAWPALGADIHSKRLEVTAGASFNTPAAGNRLGMKVAYVSTVGDDLWGRTIQAEMLREGLSMEFLRVAQQPLPAVSAALNFGDDRGFVTFEALAPEEDDAVRDRAATILGSRKVRHFHSYITDSGTELARVARENGTTVSFDASGGQVFEFGTNLAEVIPLCDVLFANDAEAQAMTGKASVRGALQVLGDWCSCVVVTHGPGGSMALVDEEVYEVPSRPTTAVDATGSGDSFNAGFLYGWFRNFPPDTCLALGNLCGRAAVQNYGGYRGCPREGELLEEARRFGILTSTEVAQQ